jgi:hypothetical protein
MRSSVLKRGTKCVDDLASSPATKSSARRVHGAGQCNAAVRIRFANAAARIGDPAAPDPAERGENMRFSALKRLSTIGGGVPLLFFESAAFPGPALRDCCPDLDDDGCEVADADGCVAERSVISDEKLRGRSMAYSRVTNSLRSMLSASPVWVMRTVANGDRRQFSGTVSTRRAETKIEGKSGKICREESIPNESGKVNGADAHPRKVGVAHGRNHANVE